MQLKGWQIYFLLITACIFVYANSLNGAFVSDDIGGITGNPETFIFNWSSPSAILNTLAIRLGGENPLLHHTFSIVLHIINTCLAFIFLKLFFTNKASFLGALLFAVHPIHTAAVTWISGRGYLVLAFFILVPYLLYYKFRDRKNYFLYYLLSLAMFSYYMQIESFGFCCAFPFIIIASDIYLKKVKRNWLLWFPLLIILALRIYTGTGLIAERITAIMDMTVFSSKPIDMLEMLLIYDWNTAWVFPAYAIFANLGFLIFPLKLTLYHEPTFIFVDTVSFWIALTIVFVISLFYWGIKRRRTIWFIIVMYLLFILPTLSPVLISWLVAERYLYLPSLALSMAIALIYEKTKWKKTFMVLFVCLFCFFTIRTILRNNDYRTPETFWKKTIEVSPFSHRAYNNLGTLYALEERYDEALEAYKKSINIKPDYEMALGNIASIYKKQGITLRDLYDRYNIINKRMPEKWRKILIEKGVKMK